MKAHSRRGAFTLMELLACIAVILILAMLLFTASAMVRDRVNTAKCASNLRALAGATISYANDHDGYLWTRADLGNSMYRMAQDPKSPVQVLSAYISPNVWVCPSAPKALQQFKQTYTWTIAAAFELRPVAQIQKPYDTLMFWDAFAYSLPTMKGASEPLDANGDGKGPATINKKYWTFWHDQSKKANWGYLDGHVEYRNLDRPTSL